MTLPLLTGNDTFTFASFAQTLANKTLTTPEINDTSADHQYVFAVSELAADRTVTLPLLAAGDTFTFNDFAATLTNKTLTSPVVTTPQINDTSSDHQYVFAASELAADRIVTLPLLAAGATLVFDAFAATLTNKTLGAGTVVSVSPTGDGVLQWAEVSLTNVNIKALRATPITLVAAPAAGKVLEFVSAVLLLDYGTNVLSETADNLAVRYTNTTGAIASETIEMTGFIDQAADMVTTARAKADVIVTAAGSIAQALVLHNTGDGEFADNAAANTLMRVKVSYRVWTSAF